MIFQDHSRYNLFFNVMLLKVTLTKIFEIKMILFLNKFFRDDDLIVADNKNIYAGIEP